jgi:hypothetical protein
MDANDGADPSMTSAIPGFFQGTEMPNSGWWEALWPDPAAVLSATGIKPGMEVIDLCCGDCWFTLPIARVARHIVAIAQPWWPSRHRQLAPAPARNNDRPGRASRTEDGIEAVTGTDHSSGRGGRP